MKALRFYGIGDVRFEQVPMPVIQEDEALVRVCYAGICGSDLHIFNKGMFVQNVPETMGHEFVGQIERVGSQVQKIHEGDLVIANPMVPCMKCESCLKGQYNTCDALGFIGEVSQGCFAEYIAVRESKLIKVTQTEEIRHMALAEPLAVALNICKRASLTETDRLAVVGAGPIGLLTVAAARQLYHVREIAVVDLSADRLELAKEAGATQIFSSLEHLDHGFDKIVEAAGVQATTKGSFTHLTAGGTLYIVSIFEKEITLDMNAVVSKQLHVVGCNVYGETELREAVAVLAEGKMQADFLITHEFSLEDGPEAFALLNAKEKKAAKILFRVYPI